MTNQQGNRTIIRQDDTTDDMTNRQGNRTSRQDDTTIKQDNMTNQ